KRSGNGGAFSVTVNVPACRLPNVSVVGDGLRVKVDGIGVGVPTGDVAVKVKGSVMVDGSTTFVIVIEPGATAVFVNVHTIVSPGSTPIVAIWPLVDVFPPPPVQTTL